MGGSHSIYPQYTPLLSRWLSTLPHRCRTPARIDVACCVKRHAHKLHVQMQSTYLCVWKVFGVYALFSHNGYLGPQLSLQGTQQLTKRNFGKGVFARLKLAPTGKFTWCKPF